MGSLAWVAREDAITTPNRCSGEKSSTGSPPRAAKIELLNRAIDVLPELERGRVGAADRRVTAVEP